MSNSLARAPHGARAARRRGIGHQMRHAGASAISLGFVAMMTSCLITEIPEFPEPERTPPFLVDSTASPALEPIHLIRPGLTDTSFTISAQVRSEGTNDDVFGYLLIDYGKANVNLPYAKLTRADTIVKPKSLVVAERTMTATWSANQDAIEPGCHTFTLMVSHAFRTLKPDGCPVDLADSSSLTWRVFVCGETEACPPPDAACLVDSPLPEPCYCPSDPAYNPAGAPLCPEPI